MKKTIDINWIATISAIGLLGASLAGRAEPTVQFNQTEVELDEGSVAEVRVRLTEKPAATVNVNMERSAGDITLAPGSVVRFTSSYPRVNGDRSEFNVILYDQDAPNTVARFLQILTNEDYADGIAHQVVRDTLVAGGLYHGVNELPELIVPSPGPIANESLRRNAAGTIAMQKEEAASESAGKEWFFNVADNADPFDSLDGGYTAFGQVVGTALEDVLRPIGALSTYGYEAPDGAVTLSGLPLEERDDEGLYFVTLHPFAVLASTELTFTRNNWNTWQSVWVSAGRDPDAADEQATLQASGDGVAEAELPMVARDAETLTVVTQPDVILVPEGRFATFQVRLSHAYDEPVDVTVTRQSGDEDLRVTDGQNLTFPADAWDTFQTVTVEADTDTDKVSGTATFRIEGDAIQPLDVTVRESDESEAIVPDIRRIRLTVGERGIVPVRVRLREEPEDDIEVQLVRVSGDADIRVPPIIRFSSQFGDFDVALHDQDVPNTVANFLNYVHDGDYDNSIIHTADAEFVVQGGAYRIEENSFAVIDRDDPVDHEDGRSNVRGTLSMALESETQPDSATSGWFINMVDNSNGLDAAGNWSGYTVFGQVLGDGMDIVDTIAALPLARNQPELLRQNPDQNPGWGDSLPDLPLANWTHQSDTMRTNNFVLFSDVTEIDGATLRFTPDNWDTEQAVWIRADADDDAENGQATFALRWAGGPRDVVERTVTIQEDDKDWRVTVAAAGNGSVNPNGAVGFDPQRTEPLAVSATAAAGSTFSHWTVSPRGPTVAWRTPTIDFRPWGETTLTAHFAPDQDGDDLPDEWERTENLDPTVPNGDDDPDGDIHTNLEEYRAYAHPRQTDDDNDGLANADERDMGTERNAPDSDNDHTTDGWEQQYGLDPLDPGDAVLDTDGDGWTNRAEYYHRTDPTRYVFRLRAGWNDIGVARAPAAGAMATLADNANVANTAWRETNGILVAAQEFESETAYWLWAYADTELVLPPSPAPTSPTASATIVLRKGWNRVSLYGEPTTPAAIDMFADVPAVRLPVLVWTAEGFVEVHLLRPGYGYWVYCTEDNVVVEYDLWQG